MKRISITMFFTLTCIFGVAACDPDAPTEAEVMRGYEGGGDDKGDDKGDEGGGDKGDDKGDEGGGDKGDDKGDEGGGDDNSCKWECDPCKKYEKCALRCEPIGNCKGEVCEDNLEVCKSGYVFDFDECKCVKDEECKMHY